jgi:hypothetical protein
MQQYTVFVDEVGSTDGYWPGEEGCSLGEVIQAVTAASHIRLIPIAWVAEAVSWSKDWRLLKDESIAAGRLIDCINGKYIPRIPSLPADATEQAEIDAAKCQPAHVEPLVQDAIRATYEASKTPEPKRAKLPHFNQRTRFNPFKGFKVTYEGEGTEPASFYSKPEQRMNEGGNALHGSAFLLV